MHVPLCTPTDAVTRVCFSPRPVPSPDFTNQKHFTSMMDKKTIYFFAICIFLLVNCLFISFPHFLPGCLSFFFFNEFERSLCIFRTDKGTGSGVRLPVSEPCLCHLLTVTLGELSDFFAPQFPHLLHEVNNNKLIIIVRVR